jgi:hypothetical protein
MFSFLFQIFDTFYENVGMYQPDGYVILFAFIEPLEKKLCYPGHERGGLKA